MMIQKANFSYVFREESVLVFKNSDQLKQTISFNCYSLQSRKKFYQFREALQNSGKKEYDNLNDIYGLAREFDIRASGGHRPTFAENIAF